LARVSAQLHQLTAGLYLVAGLLAWVALAQRSARLERAAAGVLAAGAVVHLPALALLHRAEPSPPLTDPSAALSFMAWVGAVAFLALLRRARLAGLTLLVAPMAFVGVFAAALRLAAPAPATFAGAGSWPHAHVLLASAGFALFGLSGLAGLLFLAEHRLLKAKRPLGARLPLPSLEALDRVNRVALALGFPLLTLGVATGLVWVESVRGTPWTGTVHETWSALAWAVCAVLVAARFGAGQGSRQAAASAVGGFAFLLFAVIGVEIFV
jgi:ABC-type transport system involved in cytochrome c biogenesis permease subunit